MSPRKPPANPFYFLLVLVGVAFALTATAYLVMTYQRLSPVAPQQVSESGRGLLDFMDRHGFATMMWEVGLLAILTFAAMATDSYRSRSQREQLP